MIAFVRLMVVKLPEIDVERNAPGERIAHRLHLQRRAQPRAAKTERFQWKSPIMYRVAPRHHVRSLHSPSLAAGREVGHLYSFMGKKIRANTRSPAKTMIAMFQNV